MWGQVFGCKLSMQMADSFLGEIANCKGHLNKFLDHVPDNLDLSRWSFEAR